MVAGLAAAFVFVALLCAAVGFYVMNTGGEEDRRLRALKAQGPAQGAEARSLLRRSTSAIPTLRRALDTSSWADRAALDLDRAHISLRVGEYLMLRIFTAALLFAIPLLAARGQIVGLAVAIPLALVGFMLPALYVTLKKRRRLHAIDRQLVEGLSHIANSIRAGFAMLQAIDAAAQRLQPPLSEEFSRLVADVRLGASLEDALTALGNRVGSYDLDMVITAIMIQRSTGGNLSEVLDNVAETIRERDRIRGEIRVLTAQMRFAAWVLSLWPAVLAGIFFLLNPDLMSNLWTEAAGIVLLVIAGILQLLGFFTIRRIAAIEI
ncbi:MAG: type II secretion system F family protein [Dehalococcoidia bacterium]|nr:type II secretion system F family protein [Dehalococcoidia bacterium]